TRWAILAILVLGGSSAIGLVVKGYIKPMRPDYNRIYGSTTVRTTQPVNPTRYDLQPGPQPFSAPAKPTTSEAVEFTAVLQEVMTFQAGLNTGLGAEWQFRSLFDSRRMAEEWVRFGASTLPGQSNTE